MTDLREADGIFTGDNKLNVILFKFHVLDVLYCYLYLRSREEVRVYEFIAYFS